jgi:hypothetical protein
MTRISYKQLSSILAGLRLLQDAIDTGELKTHQLPHFHDVEPLTSIEIDEICEEINLNELEIVSTPTIEIDDDSKIKLVKTRNVSCNANEEITYEIDRKTWEQALSEFDNNEEHALLDLQHHNKVVRLDYDSEITEINAEFDVCIEEA